MGHEIRPEDIGLVTVKAEDEIQPFMVAFLKAVNHVKARTTRDTKTRIKKSTSTLSSIINGYKSKYSNNDKWVDMSYLSK
ncbi:hypothetical protein NQ314_009374 [Rhamnusium bicolor]|uniref:Uncharacterized protein n=1 Tax=Rhamnusium bicolor TaxID=1586634 RepID=A0AAV8Y1N9_9CUCU|nr:hypothetical protein NQ314_009374 [Rhamnusium bicolor]